MQFFRLRLILALVLGITLVSVASTYFEVLAHKHVLRQELKLRAARRSTYLQSEMEKVVAGGQTAEIAAEAARLRSRDEALGLAVYDTQGGLVAEAGPAGVFGELPRGPLDKAIQGVDSAVFGNNDDQQWLEEAIPLYDNGRMAGALVILEDARSIRTESMDVWRHSFWRIAAFVLLIVGVTLLMVRWFLMRPMMRVADRLRRLRMGHVADPADENMAECSLFTPLVREVETMAESLMEARAAAETEARLRDAGEHQWTAERLAVHVRERFGSSRIFVLSNREPYIHVRQGRETVCVVPPSGLVTAIEPVLRACDGVWVAHGSGSEDALNVDEFDRLRVPPGDPRYSLRRVWLSSEEEAGYYDGFANEGLWPLCHIAHTRPIFRASDWECYQRVNEKFADALLEEMKGSVNPIVFVQDYHLALAPRLIKAARPDARVAIFWHIPWPNPEAFGICPWQAELLDGLLGADLIGFHIPLHCNNFLSTVDRVLESRTDREHMTVRRHEHTSAVRPYPVSVALDGSKQERRTPESSREKLLEAFGLRCETLIVGVDRMDYTKGIVERLVAVEHLLKEHPWYLERLTMVQIAAPSRTRIASYIDLNRKVKETVERINQRYQTSFWKPVLLIERQCSHAEVDLWYRAAEVCLVTSLHDGMNLVAKEYVAARDDEDGVLVLSKFAGAATELGDALIVNPYDIEGVAEAIHQGLEMDRGERRKRMRRMRQHVMDHNIYRWAAIILGDLRDLRMESAGATDMIHALPASVSPAEVVHRKLA
ncbi:MAG: trehalose-6-phosphate synthase [Terracidiphilus sp.]|jgi:trehalose 6-phosphate synthase